MSAISLHDDWLSLIEISGPPPPIFPWKCSGSILPTTVTFGTSTSMRPLMSPISMSAFIPAATTSSTRPAMSLM